MCFGSSQETTGPVVPKREGLPDKDNWWHKPISQEELSKLTLEGSLKRKLELTPLEWASIGQLHFANDGTPVQRDANGRDIVTEANSGSNNQFLLATALAARGPTISGYAGSLFATVDAMKHRIDQIPINTNAGGESAVVDLFDGSGLGAFFPVVVLKRIISNVADAATTLTITVTGGLLVGPAAFTLNLVADTVNEQFKDIKLWDLTDGSSIHAQITGGPISGTIWLEVERWAET